MSHFNEEDVLMNLRKFRVPEGSHGAIVRYLVHHIHPGGFLAAVFSNQLMEAFARADGTNHASMEKYAVFLYNAMPASRDCWGSPAAVAKWIDQEPEMKDRLFDDDIRT